MSKVQVNLTARTRSLTTKGDPFYDEIAQTVSGFGWTLMAVHPDPESSDSLPFIYTIGNYECGLPELLIIGCEYEGGGRLLNKIAARMRHYNRAFMDGEGIDLGKKCQPKAFWANDEAQEYTVQVGEYYGTDDYAVQQIVVPDTLGRYPDDPQCDLPFRLVPLLRNKALNMTNNQSNYELLPRAERRRAQKYAKKLLQTVPALRDPDQPVSLRGALDTAVLKAENVMAARVFHDAENQWLCEVIFRRGDGIGVLRNDRPLPRRDQAVTCLEHYIGSTKGAQEHPLVSEFRKLGIDPERVEMLRVRHDSFGVRWVAVPVNEISTRARAFAEQVELLNGPLVDKQLQVLAWLAIREWAPQFAAGPLLLAADSNSETAKKEFEHCLDAAAFALEHGHRTFYDSFEEPNWADVHDLDFGPPTATVPINQRGEDQCIGSRSRNAGEVGSRK